MSAAAAAESAGPRVDVRGPRFAAWVTTVVLIIALLLRSEWVMGFQALVFALGATLGVRLAPYGLVFRFLVAPRIGRPTATEDARPPQFAQAIGVVFAVVSTVGFAIGNDVVGLIAGALALIAAVLNAAFGLCLGCELYLLGRRLSPRRRAPAGTAPAADPRR